MDWNFALFDVISDLTGVYILFSRPFFYSNLLFFIKEFVFKTRTRFISSNPEDFLIWNLPELFPFISYRLCVIPGKAKFPICLRLGNGFIVVLIIFWRRAFSWKQGQWFFCVTEDKKRDVFK